MFADIERERLFLKVNPLVTKLVEKALSISKAPSPSSTQHKTSRSDSSGSQESAKTPEDLMQLWLSVSALRRGLETGRAQLQKMVTYCRGLSPEDARGPGGDAARREEELIDLAESGERIEQRLGELIGEYDEKIRECATVIDGMVLATQLVRRTLFINLSD